MQYAAHLPNTRALVAPIVALAIGAAGATGVYALVDDNSLSSTPAAIVVTQPASSSVDESAVASAVAHRPVSVSSSVDESAVASAVAQRPVQSPNEAGTAAAIGRNLNH